MRPNVFLLLVAILAAGSVRAAEPVKGSAHAAKRKIDIALDPRANDHGPVIGSAWLSYALIRAKAVEDRGNLVPAPHNRSADDYALELAGREGMEAYWERLSEKGDRPESEYLDLLVEIKKAGFLEEYVVYYFAKPGWTVPPESLAKIDMKAFFEWSRTHLKNHEPVTLAAARFPDLPPLAVPGAMLPDPDKLWPTVTSCAKSTATVAAAIAQWKKESATVEGVPLAASSPAHFARLVEMQRTQPDAAKRGITWVAHPVMQLYFLKGFCASDAGNFKEAIEPLSLARALDPLAPSAYLELSHAHAVLHDLESAESALDPVFSITADACDLARAWRQRGFLLVERNKLTEAHDAYAKSLEYEPKSAVAANELRFIDAKLKEAGGAIPKPLRQTTMTTRCGE